MSLPKAQSRKLEEREDTPSSAGAKSTFREYAEALLVALLLALVIRTFVVQAFKIPSGSMLPTLQIGDHILVNKFIYGLRVPIYGTRFFSFFHPEHQDVIVFVFPEDRDKDFIKRVIAVEGETVEVRDKHVLIDGQPRADPYATFVNPHGGAAGDNYGPYTVPAGTIFVMGDNRDQSYDSRFWGPVPIQDIKGLAMVIYWSWNDDGGSWVRWERIGQLIY